MQRKYLKVAIIALCFFCLVGCHRVSQDNFNKIKTGMTLKEVTDILGPPTQTEGVDFLGFSGTSATWKSKNAEIVIQFLNDKVQIKIYNTIK
jgi:hypothetical protein